MTSLLRLTRHSLRRHRGLAFAACLLLFFLQILLTLVARAFEVSGQFSRLADFIPEFIRPFVDQTFLASLSFAGMVSFGYTHPIVLILMIAQAIAAATEPVGEVESKFVDLLMARPVGRATGIGRSIAAMALLTGAAVGSMVLGTWAGIVFLAPDGARGPETATVLGLAANLTLLVVAWGAIALAIGAYAKRRATAATIAGLAAFATFVLDFVGRVWDVMAPVARLSPFHYYAPLALVAGNPLPPGDLVVLGSIGVAGCSLALAAWRRRDL